jgi:phosphohistidine swiveling domain-containing protein
MVVAGTLRTPEDVFYLETSELTEALTGRGDPRPDSDLHQEIDQRRELREARKKLHPPGIIPEGSRWRIGLLDLTAWETQKRNARDADILQGFAVSPGTVRGIATVILSPNDFNEMRPDTILVCPTTTPAWTPLLAHAKGLVTDIGGILAHGSIVAREYGIPAVLGTGNSTQRIVSGQRITVDGNTGTVTILE